MVERDIATFLKRTGMSVTTFGRRACNDPRLVLDMRKGRELRPRTVARIVAFMAGYPR